MKGLYQFIRDSWQNPNHELWFKRLIEWRRQGSITRLDYPTRLDRARSLGYKAKQGYVLVRVKLRRGGRLRKKFRSGRKPKKMRRLKVININYQTIAEQRANKKYPNCEVLNSYYVAKDGKYYWYEIILVDKNHPAIKSDPRMNWISKPQHTGRVYRGLTSSAKRSRGLRRKGIGAEKVRPSLRANLGRLH